MGGDVGAVETLLARVVASPSRTPEPYVLLVQQIHDELVEAEHRDQSITNQARQLLLDMASVFRGATLPFAKYVVLRGVFQYWIGIVKSEAERSPYLSGSPLPEMPQIQIRNQTGTIDETIGRRVPTTTDRLRVILSVIAIVVLVVQGGYSASSGGASGMTAGLLLGAAFLMVGGLLGFVFGLPSPHPQRPLTEDRVGPVTVNTNLEKVSNWLTKVLLGAGLVYIRELVRAFFDAGEYVAQAANIERGAAILSATGVALAISGLAVAYLFTRFNLVPGFERRARSRARQDKMAVPRFVLAETIALETKDDTATRVFSKGTSLPASYAASFSTADDNQEKVEIHMVVGGAKTASANRSIVKTQVKLEHRKLAGVPQIDIVIKMDAIGRVTVDMTERGGSGAYHCSDLIVPVDYVSNQR